MEGGMASETHGDVVIIGAGPAGLATGACLRARAVSFDIIEKDSTVASSWRARYERLRLHTVKRSSALPMVPFPREYPRYVPRDLLIKYLQDYAERFDLRPRFNETVRSVHRVDGRWLVKTNDGRHRARAVVVATGYSAVPYLPSIEGSECFAGPMLHSSSYVNARPFEGRSVLVVGLGNSGAEIVLDLAENGAQTTLSVRASAYLAPRDPFGVPIQQLSILSALLPSAASRPGARRARSQSSTSARLRASATKRSQSAAKSRASARKAQFSATDARSDSMLSSSPPASDQVCGSSLRRATF